MTETIDSANAAASTLFLGRNGEFWDFWLMLSLAFTAAAAIAVMVTTTGSIVSHKREAAVSENALATYKLDTTKTISEANARTKEAELKLEQLRMLAGPRGVDPERLKAELAGKPKAKVAIWYLPDSSDGLSFARRLYFALSGAGWEASTPIPIPEIDEETIKRLTPSWPEFIFGSLRGSSRAVLAGGAEWGGVTVVGDLLTAAGLEPNKAQDTPFMVLVNALMRSGNFNVSSSPANPFNPVPPGTLRVVIAAKADPIFIPDAILDKIRSDRSR